MRRLSVLLLPLLSLGCFPYVYQDREKVLIPGVDIASSLEIARLELEEGGFDATLAIWAIRDQLVSAEDARAIAALYVTHIDRIAAEKDELTAAFGVWHFAWAIANLYRNGDEAVRTELEGAHLDATKRPDVLKHFQGIAREHVIGEKIYMGDIHGPARTFARSHIVAPGNEDYLQSLNDYLRAKAHE